MASRFVGKPIDSIINCGVLQLGEFAEIINGGIYQGCIITKIYGNQFVVVYSPTGDITPFEITWSGTVPTFQLRILGPNESVILSN